MIKIKGVKFIYVFIGSLIGMMFSTPFMNLCLTAASGSTGIAATIYTLMPSFYPLCILGMMVTAMYFFFKSQGRGTAFTFISIFVTGLIGMMFTPSITALSVSASENFTNASLTLGAVIYDYLPVLYALCNLGIMVGGVGAFFYSRGRKKFRRR